MERYDFKSQFIAILRYTLILTLNHTLYSLTKYAKHWKFAWYLGCDGDDDENAGKRRRVQSASDDAVAWILHGIDW